MITFNQDRKKFFLTSVRLSEGRFTPMYGNAKREVRWAVTAKALREAFAKPIHADSVRNYALITFERTRQNSSVPRQAKTVKVNGFSMCAAERRIGCTNFSPRNWKLILKTLGVK